MSDLTDQEVAALSAQVLSARTAYQEARGQWEAAQELENAALKAMQTAQTQFEDLRKQLAKVLSE